MKPLFNREFWNGQIIQTDLGKINFGLSVTVSMCMTNWLIGFTWHSPRFNPIGWGSVQFHLGPIWFSLCFKRGKK